MEDRTWIEKIPVLERAVSVDEFVSFANRLYSYMHNDVSDIVSAKFIGTILYSCGFTTSAYPLNNSVTKEGKAYVCMIDNRVCLNDSGQIFIKEYLRKNGFQLPDISKKAPELLPFAITEEQIRKFEYSDSQLTLLQILARINNLIDTKKYRKLTSNAIADFLVDEGLLAVIPVEGGRFYRRATKKGGEEGILYREKQAGDGNTYLVNLYDKEAQYYIIDNLQTIALFNSGERKVRESRLNEVPVFEVETKGGVCIRYH